MKILVAQLARLGDIYLTWPVLNALKRQNPDAEIHVLVRERYADACLGLDPSIVIHTLESKYLLETIYSDGNEEQALRRVSKFVDELLEHRFDRVINLSFSPMSSFLSHAFERMGSEVHGYTRHPDGFFQVADEGSAYFYAQVGSNSFNRYHLLDVFALIAGVQLESVDMCGPDFGSDREIPERDYICIHVGASEAEKQIPVRLIHDLTQFLCQEHGLRVILVGSEEERFAIEQAFQGQTYGGRLVNLVGATSVEEAVALVSQSCLVIGGDSFAMHVATLASTPSVNLSCSHVNFWETGPLSISSRVVYKERMEDHTVEETWLAISEILSYKSTTQFIRCQSERLGEPRYYGRLPEQDEFQWAFISALYSGTNFPVLDDFSVYKNLASLAKMSKVACETVPEVLDVNKRSAAFELLNQIDTSIDRLADYDSHLFPLIRWFQTEKVRLGPQEFEPLAEKTQQLYESLLKVCSLYVENEDIDMKEVSP
ncbi:MAG: glycosyltransferase family 9 protein [Bdellovibrionales bacterium]|nr:glycosyltransferase family 9 protein [Bdellovibrionales bacterium]